MIETIIFLAASLGFAGLLWYDRPSRARVNGLRLLRTFLIVLLPWAGFVGAVILDNGDRLTLRVDQLRIPQSVVQKAGGTDFQPFLIVGDRPDMADLVVSPYIDQSLSRISMPVAPRALVAVEARPTAAPDGTAGLDARLRLQSFEGVPDLEIPGMGVSLHGRHIGTAEAESIPLVPGTAQRLTIFRIDGDGHWAERRSFAVTLRTQTKPVIEIDLASPIVADAGSCELPRLRISPMASGDALEPEFRDPENLVFGGLGAGGANPLLEKSWLGPIADAATMCAQTQTALTWPNSVDRGEARLRLVSQKVFLPWYCCIFATICTFAMHFLFRGAWQQPTPERIVVPLLQWLLALRLLIAVAGYYNDLSLFPWRVLWDAMAAYLCLPALAVIALRPGLGRDIAPVMTGIVILIAAGFLAMLISLKASDPTSFPALLCYVTIIAALLRPWLPGALSPLAAAFAWLEDGAEPQPEPDPDPGAGRMPWWRRVARAWQALRRSFRWGLILIVSIVAFRLALVGIGLALGGNKYTERLFGFPLSLLHVPGMILGFALLLDGVRRQGRWASMGWAMFAFAAAYVLVPLATRDIGALFVCGWPLAVFLAWFGLRRRSGGGPWVTRWGWLTPVAVPVMIVLGYGLILLVEGPVPPPLASPPAQMAERVEGNAVAARNLGPHIAEVNRWDRNAVRMLAFLAPQRVEQLGTKYAFESLDMMTSLAPLTADIAGNGYLAPSNVRPPLLDNQYFENLAAVHLIWPLGRLGTLGLLLVLGIAMLVMRPSTPSDPVPVPEWPRLAAALARITFGWAAVYMVLANLNWVPFTGRNIYLLAVSSNGDVAEGLVLVLLMCVPFVLAEAKAR